MNFGLLRVNRIFFGRSYLPVLLRTIGQLLFDYHEPSCHVYESGEMTTLQYMYLAYKRLYNSTSY